MVIERVLRYWGRGNRSSPGIGAATSAGVAPQVRCQPRSRGAVRNRGRSATTSRTCRTRSAGVGRGGAHRGGSGVVRVGGPLVGSVRVGIIGAPRKRLCSPVDRADAPRNEIRTAFTRTRPTFHRSARRT